MRYLILSIVISSYPTYEEWKHKFDILDSIPKEGSYPTYEEWKLLLLTNAGILLICSYPTYEEWKLYLNICHLFLISVLILPMRNGNYKKKENLYS